MFRCVGKNIPIWCLLLFSVPTFAEGIVDIKPYISTSLTYDDNVFRFSSPAQAKAAFGSSVTSDAVKRIDLGVDVNLRLSRQLVTLAANINESRYSRFDILDNKGKSYRLGWSWRLGNDLYGELSASENESLAGFTEIRNPVNNLRTSTRQRASINWNLHPEWTLHMTGEQAKIENELNSFSSLDRKDEIIEGGIRYQNPTGTQLGLAYRVTASEFPNRIGFAQFLFGNESKQKTIVASAAWSPTTKTRVSTQLAQVNIEYQNKPQRDFQGFSQRWNLDQSLSAKTSINLTAYQEVSPIDDVESTYVQSKGATINPTWNITSKVVFLGGLGYEERAYLGSAGFFATGNNDRSDESKTANLSLLYTPSDKSLIQLQYQGEKRTSSIDGQGYRFNTLNFLVRYGF
jgi:exopolysaccharide biosynthesis operon protein EpsL